jgi:hypothetical protein
MSELYGDIETAKAMLRPTGSASFNDDAEVRLAALQAFVSQQLEYKTGRIFGGTATPTTRTVQGNMSCPDEILDLPMPVRSVSAVAITGNSPETVADSDYVLWYGDRLGDYHAIRRTYGSLWPWRNGIDAVAVTAVWSDEANGGAVPDDITYAANYLIAELFKSEQASPAGFTGPDGATVPIRDPWKNSTVTSAIEAHRVNTMFLAF